MIELTIDGRTTHAPEGTTILQACNRRASTRRRCVI